MRFEGALDAQGRASALRADVACPSIMAGSGFMEIPDSGVDSMAVEGIADHAYAIANQRVAYGRAEPGTPPIAPAFCNALSAAAGVRVRELPIARATLKKSA